MPKLSAHLKYAKYVIRHKTFVLMECLKIDHRLFLQGLLHDVSKLTPTEWVPYVNHFYGDKPSPRDKTGAYDPLDVGPDFDMAWLSHQHHNPHHWQYWILRGDSDGQKAMKMPLRYRQEMLADWRGAGRAMGKPDTKAWYLANKDKMVLHPKTRRWVELKLGVVPHTSVWDWVDED